MSSPTILVATKVPSLVARSRNRDEIQMLLAKISQVYSALCKLREETNAAGGDAPVMAGMHPEEARARAEQLFASGDDAGWSAVVFLHAYWQSLKHNDLDRALKRHAEVMVTRQMQTREEERNVTAFAEELFRSVQARIAHDVPARTVASEGPLLQWSVVLKRNLDAIAKCCDPTQVEVIAGRVSAIMDRPRTERIVALETLRLSIEQEAKLQRENAIVQSFQRKQAELTSESARAQLLRCATIAQDLSLPREHAAMAELIALQAAAQTSSAPMPEERVASLETLLLNEKSCQGLLQATMQSLRRQGYERVEVMATLSPGDVRPVYMADPQDPDRMTLLMVDETDGLVAAEVVSRTQLQESRLERQLDLEAQKRLCNAMNAARRSLEDRFTCEVEQTPPGKPVMADPRLAHIPARSRAHAARAQQQQARRNS